MGDLIYLPAPARETAVTFSRGPSDALISWNASAPSGALDVALTLADGRRTKWLRYATWSEAARRSGGESDGEIELATDIVRAAVPVRSLDVRSHVDLDALWIATPPDAARRGDSGDSARAPVDLDVPAFSQYLEALPGERGLCSPASLAMLMAYWGTRREVAEVAAGVRDEAYGGTGNWAFNAAFAASLGFAAATAYLRGLAHAQRFLAAGIPLAVSIAWSTDALPGAPIPASAGHLLVIRGFAADGAVLVNDPAQPAIRFAYPRGDFERAWLGHGGVAYLCAPRDRAPELLALANA